MISPGPWTQDGYNVHDASGRVIAGAMVSKADARLMAASRELMEALRIHHEWSIRNMPEYSENGDERVAYRVTTAVLARCR